MNGGHSYAHAPKVLSRQTLGQILVRVPGQPIVALPGTAAEVWALLETPRQTDEMVAELAERYCIEGAAVAADLSALLDELLNAGLIVRFPGSSHVPARG